MARPEKVADVEEIQRRLQSGEASVFIEMRGLSVAEVTTLRQKFRDANVSFKVFKNTLIQRAGSELGISGLEPILHGPTALAVCNTDPTAAVKVVRDFTKTVDKVTVKGGVLGSQAINAADAQMLGDLPTRQQSAGQLAGVLNAPISGLARSLNALIAGVAIALNRVVEQQSGQSAEA